MAAWLKKMWARVVARLRAHKVELVYERESYEAILRTAVETKAGGVRDVFRRAVSVYLTLLEVHKERGVVIVRRPGLPDGELVIKEFPPHSSEPRKT